MHRPLGRFLSGRRNFFGWHRIGGRLSMTSSHAPVGQLFWMVDRRFFCQKKFRSNRFGFVSDHHRFRRETRWFVVVVVFPGFFFLLA